MGDRSEHDRDKLCEPSKLHLYWCCNPVWRMDEKRIVYVLQQCDSYECDYEQYDAVILQHKYECSGCEQCDYLCVVHIYAIEFELGAVGLGYEQQCDFSVSLTNWSGNNVYTGI